MKIATSVLHFHKRGGLERAAVEISQHLVGLSHEVMVYAATADEAELDGMTYIHVRSALAYSSSAHLSFRRNSRNKLRTAPVDIIHAHGTEPGLRDVVTFQSCHRAGVELRKKLGESAGGFGVSDRIRIRTEARTLKQGAYRKIIAVSRGLKRELCELYRVPEQDIVVIPNGVNLNEFFPPDAERRQTLRKKFGIADDEIALIFLGHEFDRKGLRFILDALTLIPNKRIRLIVAGKDDPAKYIEDAARKGIADRVTFIGAADSSADLLQAGDAFVLPTLHEAFPLAAIEAAACGLTLLATSVNGIEEYLRDGENGYIVERNGDSIAARIRLLQDETQRHKLGANAAETAKRYSWVKITNETVRVYEDVLAIKSGSA
jgi:UDP-glucose:(heptosyl)LPS alpha-1,3-glucosyltransferase